MSLTPLPLMEVIKGNPEQAKDWLESLKYVDFQRHSVARYMLTIEHYCGQNLIKEYFPDAQNKCPQIGIAIHHADMSASIRSPFLLSPEVTHLLVFSENAVDHQLKLYTIADLPKISIADYVWEVNVEKIPYLSVTLPHLKNTVTPHLLFSKNYMLYGIFLLSRYLADQSKIIRRQLINKQQKMYTMQVIYTQLTALDIDNHLAASFLMDHWDGSVTDFLPGVCMLLKCYEEFIAFFFKYHFEIGLPEHRFYAIPFLGGYQTLLNLSLI